MSNEVEFKLQDVYLVTDAFNAKFLTVPAGTVMEIVEYSPEGNKVVFKVNEIDSKAPKTKYKNIAVNQEVTWTLDYARDRVFHRMQLKYRSSQ